MPELKAPTKCKTCNSPIIKCPICMPKNEEALTKHYWCAPTKSIVWPYQSTKEHPVHEIFEKGRI